MGGIVGDSQASMLTSLGIKILGGAVGFDWYDSIREFVLDMTVGTQSKQTLSFKERSRTGH